MQESNHMNNDPQIDNNEIQELLTTIHSISTYSEADEWGKRAAGMIENIKSILRGLDVEIARNTQSLEKLKYEASKKFLGRLFSGGNEEKELTSRLDEYKSAKVRLVNAENQLQDFIDFTPKSVEEQQGLLAELRLRKKTLQEKKREITQVVRGPRMTKPQGEPSNTVFNAATLERRKIRYDREAHLLPNETTSASLARQIAQVERDLLWVEKFTG
jgi:hypothetical protein